MEFNIFLDTNVILDWLLDRLNCFADEATQIIEISELKNHKLYASAGSIYTIAYILEKSGKKDEILRKTMIDILQILNTVKADNDIFIKACSNGMKDLEDAFQFEIASSTTFMNYFVTGNIKNYRNKTNHKMKIVNPREVLNYI